MKLGEYPGDLVNVKRGFSIYEFSWIDFVSVCAGVASGVIWYYGNDLIRSIYIGVICGGLLASWLSAAGMTGLIMSLIEAYAENKKE